MEDKEDCVSMFRSCNGFLEGKDEDASAEGGAEGAIVATAEEDSTVVVALAE
ncbi:molybdopterin-binding protein [Sesbania bispinosa]|nr:molybdopterin-binding protein [Sesbania bispinosa]